MAWENGERGDEGGERQLNFFNRLRARPEFPINGYPSRSRECFWREDILPTTHLLRQIYIKGGVTNPEIEMLDSAWKWFRRHPGVDIDSKKKNVQKRIPFSVRLNHDTVRFFGMRDDFKKPQSGRIFEAFIAYRPGTLNWENDVRQITFDYVAKLRTRPYEKGTRVTKAVKQAEQAYRSGLDLDEETLSRLGTIDTITWALLFYYHNVLFHREKTFLAHLKMT